MRRLFIDRSDGIRIRHKDPVLKLIPYIMPKRYDAQVFFEDSINLTKTDAFLKAQRKEGMKVTFLHIVVAAIVRTLLVYPKANRFVSNRRVYARKHIALSFAMKKAMTEDAEETIIKLFFTREDTFASIVEKINHAIETNRGEQRVNSVDKLTGVLRLLPGWFLRLFVLFARVLDAGRFLPKALIKASPFHSSVFITDLGSLGVEPVYHHIYDFGTTSIFYAFGMKRKLKEDGHVHKTMNIKVTVDERIVDGYYLAKTIKAFKRSIESPEVLLEACKTPGDDDGVKKRKKMTQ